MTEKTTSNRPSSATAIAIEELKRLMIQVAEKAAASAVAGAEARMSEIVQNALEEYQLEDEDDLVEAVKSLTGVRDLSTKPESAIKKKRGRTKVTPGVKLGSLAMAKVGNGYLPVRIKSGPFKFEGKSLYKVERLTPGKNFTGGMKPLDDLYEFTAEDAEALKTTAPSARKA